MLIQGLPHEAATWRAEAWSIKDELLASVVEIIDLWGRRYASMQGVKARDIPEPVHIPRPGDEERREQSQKVETDPGVIAAFFSQHFK